MTNVLLPVRSQEAERAESAVPTLPDGEALHVLLSPELVLVDPDLAAAARLLLPDPVVLERTRPRPAEPALRTAEAPPSPLPPRPLEAAPARRAPARHSRLAAIAATGLAAVAAAALGFALTADDRAAEQRQTVEDASRAALQAQAARQARAARTYTWPAVPGAAAYEFEILRGKSVVFATTTRHVTVEVPARVRLRPGRYTWSVTPRLGEPGATSGARPVVEGAFLLPSS